MCDISCFGLIVQDSEQDGQAKWTKCADRQQSQLRDGKLPFVCARKKTRLQKDDKRHTHIETQKDLDMVHKK